jgi:hypothetical protein
MWDPRHNDGIFYSGNNDSVDRMNNTISMATAKI